MPPGILIEAKNLLRSLEKETFIPIGRISRRIVSIHKTADFQKGYKLSQTLINNKLLSVFAVSFLPCLLIGGKSFHSGNWDRRLLLLKRKKEHQFLVEIQMSETFADKTYPAESNRSFALEIAKITESESS